ncbi:hypothetical protein ABIC76_003627 [Ralstonia sp. 1138]
MSVALRNHNGQGFLWPSSPIPPRPIPYPRGYHSALRRLSGKALWQPKALYA